MIILLPPSESKLSGGQSKGQPLSFPSLEPARDQVAMELLELCQNPDLASKALKLGPKQSSLIAANLEIQSGPFLPSIERYDGVLFEAIKRKPLSPAELKFAAKNVFIQSALFGPIGATDLIPNYRLSGTTHLGPKSLKAIWQSAHAGIWENFRGELILDLRSNAYSDLAPIPDSIEHFDVEVLEQDQGGIRKTLNHFNKAAKGEFAREFIETQNPDLSLKDLKSVAKKAGLGFEIRDRKVLLITHR
ncbi:MAG: YaaA family protein [Actinomycetota bacterium]